MATAALTGTAAASATESDVVAGGKTIVLTLTGDTWPAFGGGAIVGAIPVAITPGATLGYSPAGGATNEPTGMTLITSRGFNAADEGGWSDSWGTLGTIVTDATAPESPSNVLQMHLPAGFGEGGGPCSGDLTFPTNYRTLYVRYSCKFDANWQGPSSGIDKAFYIYDDAGHPTLIFDMDGDGFVDKSPQVAGQDIINAGTPSPGGDLANPFWLPTVDGTLIPRGQWFTVEFIAVANTAGTANGSLDWWVDGVHKGSQSGVQFTTGARLWNLLHYTEIYTGTSGTRPASAQNVYWDHLYISGK